MVDFDLRKLSAPVEALRSEVDAAYKRLDATWAEVTAHLKELPIPCTVRLELWMDPDCPENSDFFEWTKWNGKRRLCITEHRFYGSDTSVTVKPYEEWSGEQRVLMLNYVPALFEAAAKQTKEFIEKTQG